MRETAAAHQSYQEALTAGCKALFDSMERSLQLLAGRVPPTDSPLFPAAEMHVPAAPAPEISPRVADTAPAPVPVSPPEEPTAPPNEAPDAAVAGEAAERLFLGVVADKTGYPADLLTLDMEMESGLGIDSIKRVEIFSALTERLPAAAGLDVTRLMGLRTLGDVIAFIGSQTDAPPEKESPPEPNLGRQAIRLEAVPPAGFALPGLLDGRLIALIVANPEAADVETATARGLARRLAGWKVPAVIRRELPPEAGGAVFLGGLRDGVTIPAAEAVHRAAFQTARALARQAGDRPPVFVTVQDTGGGLGLDGTAGNRAWLGGLTVLVKTAACEWPGAGLKAIDVERGTRTADEVADAIWRELLEGGPDLEVGLKADDTRRVAAAAPADLPEPAGGDLRLRPGALVVVTGGARGVTAAAVRGLVEKQPALRLVLLGRTPLQPEPACCRGFNDTGQLNAALLQEAREGGRTPGPAELRARTRDVLARREIEETLAGLRQAGAEARYLSVDVQDAVALRQALAGVRGEWGPIHAVVHGAGVLADRRIQDKSDEQFDLVFRAKVGGLANLLEATAEDPLEALVLFSSVAARFGNAGQCDYSAANEVLNQVAVAEARRRGPSVLVRSLGWGPWAGGMVTPALRAQFEARNVPLIPLPLGGRLFAAEFGRPAGDAVVLLGVPDGTKGLSQPAPHGHSLEVALESGKDSYLFSHCIQGDVPVLPVVLVLEWFVRAASRLYPDWEIAACRDLKVLAGVPLPDLDDGCRFTITAAEDHAAEEIEVTLELLDAQGRRHYSAVMDLVPPGRRPAPNPVLPLSDVRPWDWSAREAYEDGKLFHGPAFHVLTGLDQLGPDGAGGTLRGTEEMDWPAGPWLTNPAALDGGLQIVLLWLLDRHGLTSLPTRVGRYVPHQVPAPPGPYRCEVRVRDSNQLQALCGVLFLDARGEPVAEFEDLQFTLRHRLQEVTCR
jgi:NAD(P)-dependent dehydrogenase (short-subunit alcohol dehydrogenase family)